MYRSLTVAARYRAKNLGQADASTHREMEALSPFQGWADVRPEPHGLRRGLLSCALRAGREEAEEAAGLKPRAG
jgi:hypothetical protein